jgi:guanylate kinase
MNSKEKKEKCIILGPSGSGKDFLLRQLVEMGLRPLVKYTTRPPRKLEKNKVDYYFIDDKTFKDSIDKGEFITYQSFNVTPVGRDPEVWYYGIKQEDFDICQVVILTPFEWEQLPKEDRKKLFVVLLDIPQNIRESRIANRNDDNDSVRRRIEADRIDFEGFKDYDLCIRDYEFEAKMVYDLME